MRKSTIFLAVAAMMASAFTASAQSEVIYGYANSEDLYVWGTKKAETYDIAILLNDPALVGTTISKLSVPVYPSENVTDYKMFLTSKLALESIDGKKVNVADIVSADVTPGTPDADGIALLEYTLTTPYTIPAEGVYAGYSLTVTSCKEAMDEYPIYVTTDAQDGAFYVHSSRTYRSWVSRSIELGVASMLEVTVSGDFKPNAGLLPAVPDTFGKVGDDINVDIAISNVGTNPITSIGFTVEAAGKKADQTYDFPVAIPNKLGATGIFTATIPALEKGEFEYTVTVNKVNGEANTCDTNTGSAKVTTFNIMPVHNAVMEEYTGTWCGFCVRGWTALETMKELHPDFIAIAYHNGDPMELKAGYPNCVSGYPGSWMDRTIDCDPYYGEPQAEFGIENTWKTLCAQFSPVVIDVKAEWKDDNTVTVNSTTTWVLAAEGEYRVEYVLVADDLFNNDPNSSDYSSWLQHNYYYNGSYGTPLYMEPFVTGEYATSSCELHFNDVAVAHTGMRGIAGSIPSSNTDDVSTYTYEFDLSKCINTNGQQIIQNKDNLRVVALVLKPGSDCKGYGKIMNGNVCKVPALSGINAINADKAVVGVSYFDLSGREVKNPAAGIYVKVNKYSDGTVSTSKVALR